MMSESVEKLYARVDPADVVIHGVEVKTANQQILGIGKVEEGDPVSYYKIKYSYDGGPVMHAQLQVEWNKEDECFVFYDPDWRCYSVHMEQTIARSIAWTKDYEEYCQKEEVHCRDEK